MATKAKHAYTIKSYIDYANLDFNPDDPEPLPDGMYQYPVFAEIFAILDAHLNTLGDLASIFRSSNTFICYNPNNLNVKVGPDFYAAFDVDAQAIKERLMYLPWEAGKPPDFVLEVGSPSTGGEDTGNKRNIYARIGIGEYWRFDPSGGDYHGEPLVGEELVNGEYRRFDLTTEPDGILKGYSPLLRLWLCWQEGMLTFYNSNVGEYIRNLPDTQAALQAEAEARREAEGERQAERTARQRAEARIRELEAELRRRPG